MSHDRGEALPWLRANQIKQAKKQERGKDFFFILEVSLSLAEKK